jgi:hypothetical protein
MRVNPGLAPLHTIKFLHLDYLLASGQVAGWLRRVTQPTPIAEALGFIASGPEPFTKIVGNENLTGY